MSLPGFRNDPICDEFSRGINRAFTLTHKKNTRGVLFFLTKKQKMFKKLSIVY